MIGTEPSPWLRKRRIARSDAFEKEMPMNENSRSYDIAPCPTGFGGGWKLTLWEDGQEVGGGVFPVPEELLEVVSEWWNSMTEQQQGYWLTRSASAVPTDARHAYLLAVAYDDALSAGEDWAEESQESIAPGSVFTKENASGAG